MSLKLGTTDINKLYLGSTEIKKAYLGATLVYDKTAASNGLLNNLVSYYKMDTNGSIPSEINSPTNDLSINGSSFTSLGKINGGYDHDGSNDYIENNINFGITQAPYSISSWINLDTASGFEVPWFFGDKDSDNYFRLTLNNGVPEINSRNPSLFPQTMTRRDTGNALSTGNWHHIVGVLEDINTLNLYVNGLFINTAIIDPGRQPVGMDRFSIGRSGDATPSNYFDGKTDEIGVWNKVLTQTDVTNLYNSGAGLSFDSFTT